MKNKNTFIKIRAIIVWASLSLFLSACGSGGESEAPSATVNNSVTGIFVDAVVAGVDYECSSGNTGFTNALGEFTCETGDTVSFSIAGISLGEAVAVTDVITPTTLFPDNPEAALNLAQLLQTLDSDGDPSNGITPSADLIESLENVTIDLTSSTFDTDIQTTLDSSGVVDANGDSFTLVTEDDAQEHLDDTFTELDINPDGTENTSNFTIGGTVTGLNGSGLVIQNNAGNDLSVSSDGSFVFSIQLENASYSVAVLSHPSAPSQTCSLSNATGTVTTSNITNVNLSCVTDQFTIAGTVSGLAGGTLTIQNNNTNNLVISANGAFAFSSAIDDLSNYSVSLFSDTTSPQQTCAITNATGTLSASNINNVNIDCTTNTFTVGGIVTGLAGTGLVIQNNGGDDLTLNSNGVFNFATPIADLNTYSISILSNPASPNQICTASDANGTLSGAKITNVSINCSTNNYTVGGTVSGLEGSELTLKNNAGDSLNIVANGSFTFSSALSDSSSFAVTIASQATSPQQTCRVSNGSGILTGANETGIVVNCLTHYRIGGVINGTPSGLVLQYNGANNQIINSDGAFFFSKTLVNLQSFTISVLTQPTSPNRTCVISNPSGTLSGADATATVINCSHDTFSISGTINGLTGSGLVLKNKSTDDLVVLSHATTFVFATQLIGSNGYNVSIATQPTGQSCVITPGEETGDVNNADVNDISISCSDSVSLGGNVSGLTGSGLEIQNNSSNTTAISADGSYFFSTALSNGDTYDVSISSQPTSPIQTCTVNNATGIASITNIDNVNISCTTATFKVSGTVNGLTGSLLILQNNGAENKTVNANGFYPFFLPQNDGSSYNISVYGQPQNPQQTCSIADPSGTLNGANVLTVHVVCIDDIAPQVVNLSPVDKAWDDGAKLSANVTFDANNTNIVTDAVGGALAIWTQSNGSAINLIAKHQLANGTWQADTIISDGDNDVKLPNIAIDDAGNAFAVWQQNNGSVDKVWYNHYVVGSGWAGAQLFVTGDILTDTTNESQVAMSSNGDAMVVWQHTVSSALGDEQIKASKYSKVSDTWAAPIQLSNTTFFVENPQVAINASNQAIAIWGNVGQEEGSAVFIEVQSSFYTEGTGWDTRQKIDSSSVGNPALQKIAMDNSGNAVAVWQEQNHGATRLWSNRLTASDGLWGLPEQVESNAFNSVSFPMLVMDSSGNAIVTWHQLNGSIKDYWSNYSSINTGWEKPTRLEHSDKDVSITENGLDVDANGNVIAVWSQQDDSNNLKIWANRFISSTHLWQGKTQVTTINTVTKPKVAIKSNGTAIALYSSGSTTEISASTLTNQSVAPDSTVTVTFDESMFESTIGNTSFTINNGNAVSATVIYDSVTKTAVLTPDETLARLSTYTATLNNSIADTLGNTLATSSWAFTTKDGDWGTALNIEVGTQSALEPQISFDKDGNGLAVWRQKIGSSGNSISVVSSYYDITTGNWIQPTIDVGGTPEIFDVDKDQNSTHNAFTPKVKFDGSGNGIAVWAIPNGSVTISGSVTTVYSNRYTKGSGWGSSVSSLQINGVSDDSDPELAVSDNGDAVVVYKNNNSLYANRYYDDLSGEGIGWFGPQLIETRSDNARSHKVGMDENGNAIAVWAQVEGSDLPVRIWMAKLSQATSTWSTPIAISENVSEHMNSPDLSVNANGDAMVVWYKSLSEQVIQAISYSASTDTWSTVSTIQSVLTEDGESPAVVLSDNGNAVAVWAQYHEVLGVGRTQAWANYFTGTSWGTAQTIDSNNYSVEAEELQIIIDSEGNAMATWPSEDSSSRLHMEASRYVVGQGWLTSELIEANADGNVRTPQLAVDAKGNITAIWNQRDSSSILNIWVNRFE